MPSTATNNRFQDSFKAPMTTTWRICESLEDGHPTFDTEIYCARLQGPMALFDGVSLNNRYYSKALWQKALEENKLRIAEEGLFGTLGHELDLDEDAIRNGNITHKVTNLWLNEDDKTIDGEILLLNSSAGRELNLLLRSGMKISTSSRAYGRFSGRTPDGVDVIDEEGFYLQGFDFVLNPGVETARPRIVESVQTSLNEEQQMEKELLESYKESAKLQVQLSEAVNKQTKAEEQAAKINEELSKAKEELAEAKKTLAWFEQKIGPKPVEALNEMCGGLAKWLIQPEFQVLAKEIGMFDQLDTTFEETQKKLVESYKKYAKFGGFQAIEEQNQLLAKFQELGSTPEKITEALDLLEAYLKTGKKPEEISEAITHGVKAAKVLKHAKRLVAARKIRENLKLDESKEATIVELLQKMPVKDVVESLKSLKAINEAKPTGSDKPATSKPIAVPTTKTEPAKAKADDASRALRLVESVPYNPITTQAQK